MAPAKILPFRDPGSIRDRLLDAVGSLTARVGPMSLSSAAIAMEAGVEEAHIKRLFGGFGQMLDAFAHTRAFWPSVEELAGGEVEALRELPVGEVLSLFFRNYLRGVVERPWTLAVMASESRNEKTLLTHALVYIRERRALEFFEEAIEGELPEGLDLSAIILLMALAVSFLGIRSQSEVSIGGIDIESSDGWSRIERAIEFLLVRAIDGRFESSSG